MNITTTIEMAREAGAWSQQSKNCDVEYVMTQASLDRFAKFVRADEREACAKVCDAIHAEHEAKNVFSSYADAIRARGNT